MITQNKRLAGIVAVVTLILFIPLVAKLFTHEVNWTLFDFVAMGSLLLGIGLLSEFVMRTVKNKDYQIGLLAVVLIAFFLIWAELAVGVFGSPFAGS